MKSIFFRLYVYVLTPLIIHQNLCRLCQCQMGHSLIHIINSYMKDYLSTFICILYIWLLQKESRAKVYLLLFLSIWFGTKLSSSMMLEWINNWAMVKLTNINAIKGTQCFALNAIDKINDFFSDLFLIFPIFFWRCVLSFQFQYILQRVNNIERRTLL